MSSTLHSAALPRDRASFVVRCAWLCALLATLLCFRLALLEWSFVALFTPGYELFPMGTLGHELLNGLPSLPVFEFHDTHSGGQILSALLSAVAFKVFGVTYWALKLVPVLFALATLAFLFLFLERWYGIRAACVGASLWIVGPAAYVDYSTANYGNHSEVLAFVTLTLFPLWRRFVGGDTSHRTYFLLGLTCGLAVWYALSSLLLLVLYVALWFVVERDFFRKRGFLWFIVGVFVGTLPLWYVMATYDAPQAEWMENKFAGANAGALSAMTIERLVDYCGRLWFLSPTFYSFLGVNGDHLSYAYATCWIVALVGVAWIVRSTIARFAMRGLFLTQAPIDASAAVLVPFLVYPFALAGAYAASNFKIGNWIGHEWGGYRYCITSYFVMNLLFVVGWCELRGRGKKALANVLAAVVLAIGLAGNAGHPWSAKSAGIGRHYDGYNYVQMGRLFMLQRWEQRPREDVIAAISGLEPWQRYDILKGYGYCAALTGLRGNATVGPMDVFEPSKFVNAWASAKVPRNTSLAVATGAGMMLEQMRRGQPKHVLASLDAYRDRHRRFFVHGLFLPGDFPSSNDLERRTTSNERLLAQLVDPALRQAAVEGFGMFAGTVAWRAIPQDGVHVQRAFDIVAKLPPTEQQAFVLGFGASCTRYFVDPERYDELLTRWIPQGGLSTAYRGIGMMADIVWNFTGSDVAARGTELLLKYRNDVAEGLTWRVADGEAKVPKAGAAKDGAPRAAADGDSK